VLRPVLGQGECSSTPEAVAAGHGQSYAYDTLGRLSGATDALGHATTYTYDPAGRLTGVNDRNGATTTFEYDSAGHVTKVNLPGDSSLTYAYDPLGRLTEADDADATLAFTYDDSGNLASQTSAGTPTSSQPTVALSFGRDAAGRPTSLAAPWGTSSFAYDANGLLAKVTDPTAGVFNLGYDPLGRLASLSRPNGVTDSYTYDAAGQLSSRSSSPDGSTVTYRYDALGRRVEQSSSAGTTRYVNLGANVVAEYDGTNTLRATYLTSLGQSGLPGMPLEVSVGSATSYPLVDGVGSVTALTDASGAIGSAFAYTAYGVPSGASSGTYAYGTYAYDSATGLFYARARYYDPAAGRFLSEDPKTSIDGYAYANGSPVEWSDPSGQASVRALVCAGACVFSLFTSSQYLARSGLAGFQELADKVVECAGKLTDKAAADQAAQIVFDEMLAADGSALAAEVAPAEELIIVIRVEVEIVEVEVVIEG
jgi:RHS repeat-associated protein